MKTRVLILVMLTFLGFTGSIISQEKYAILISGDLPDYIFPGVILEEGGKLWKASWNDTYLMWEMLVYEKGYDNDNVFVLWADGTDWSITSNIAGAYDAQVSHQNDFPGEFDQFTDYAATLSNVEYVFEKLANGTDPAIPQITQDDFLFVWVYGRNKLPTSLNTHIGLFQNDVLDDGGFYNLVNDITSVGLN
jgi:hypothetical protein